jgi:uroporphyrinogen-III decarboxylase
MNSKQIIKALLHHRTLPRSPFIPCSLHFALRARQISLKEMFSNPTTLANTIREAQKLFLYDGIVNVLDSSLVAEAFGCSIDWQDENRFPNVVSHPLMEGTFTKDLEDMAIEGKGFIPTIMEAANRNSLTIGKEVGVVCIVPGPITLAKHLKGVTLLKELETGASDALELVDFTRRITIKFIRLFCEMKTDLIMVSENFFRDINAQRIKQLSEIFASIWNVVHFYEASGLIITKDCNEKQVQATSELGGDGIMNIQDQVKINMNDITKKYDIYLGSPIPSSKLSQDPKKFEEYVAQEIGNIRKERRFITTELEIPLDIPLENIHQIVKCLNS